MVSIRHRLVVRQPPAVVFSALSSLEDIPRFVPQTHTVKILTEGPVRLGTRFQQAGTYMGKTIPVVMEVSGFERDRRLEYRTVSGVPQQRTSYTLLGVTDGTQVTCQVDMHLPWYLVFIKRKLTRRLEEVNRENLEQFRELLELHGSLKPPERHR
jgi:hypothetical protein